MMIHRLRREINTGTADSPEWVQSELPPMCNDRAIAMMVDLIQPLTSKNLMMSKYKEEWIFNRLRSITCDVIGNISVMNSYYEINLADANIIVQIFRSTAEPTFFRALGGNEKEYLGKVIVAKHLKTEGEQKQPRRSIFG